MKRKKTIIKICVMAILMALSMVLKKFSIDTGMYRISLFDTPLLIAGIIGGPIWGVCVAFGADFLYSLLSGFAYSFIMMFSTLLWGLVGSIFYKKRLNFFALLIVVFFTSILTTTINSVQLYVWYGAGALLTNLPSRIITMIIKWPITTIIVYLLYYQVVLIVLKRPLDLPSKVINNEEVKESKKALIKHKKSNNISPRLKHINRNIN